MKIFILTEGGRDIGFGHLARCISLYQGFKAMGITPELIVSGDDTIFDLLKGIKYRIFNWLREKNELLKRIKDVDFAVIDSYLAGKSLYYKISEMTDGKIIMIDDYNRIKYPKGIVVNPSICSTMLNYPDNKDIRYLLGKNYVMLRKEFQAVSAKVINETLKTVMITFGGEDRFCLTSKVLHFLNKNYPELIKNVFIGKAYQDIRQIEEMKNDKVNLIYYPDAETAKKAMLVSDIAISSGGQTLCELARIGTPTIGICCAQNQQQNLECWRDTSFAEYAGWYNDRNIFFKLKHSIKSLKSYRSRLKSSRIGRNIIDGKGPHRVCSFLSN